MRERLRDTESRDAARAREANDDDFFAAFDRARHRRETRRWADSLPANEREVLLAAVEELDAVCVEAEGE